MLFLHIFVFLGSCFLLFLTGSWLVSSLIRVAKFLHWREFVVAFFIMAFACSLPNLFVGINSAINKIPELSFGDIVGGNVINLTLVIALAILIGGTVLPAESRMVQNSAVFSVFAALMPLVLILDGVLDRIDAIILFFIFGLYVFWLFSKEERFKKIYSHHNPTAAERFPVFIKDLGKIVLSLILLLAASQGIVKSAVFFSNTLNLALPLIGILIVGFGNTLPEMYFSIVSARKRETWMILGDLIGSVIYTSTLVLGIVALIQPIRISDISSLVIARIFLIISALFFWIIIRSGKKITKTEGVVSLGLYILFLMAIIFFK